MTLKGLQWLQPNVQLGEFPRTVWEYSQHKLLHSTKHSRLFISLLPSLKGDLKVETEFIVCYSSSSPSFSTFQLAPDPGPYGWDDLIFIFSVLWYGTLLIPSFVTPAFAFFSFWIKLLIHFHLHYCNYMNPWLNSVLLSSKYLHCCQENLPKPHFR